MPLRPCIDCGRLSTATRCPEHTRAREGAREAARAPQRATTNPWRWVYADARWKKARKHRLEIDDGLCVDCNARATAVDHDPALADRPADNLDPFNVEKLRSRCDRCHARRDGARRRVRKQRRPA